MESKPEKNAGCSLDAEGLAVSSSAFLSTRSAHLDGSDNSNQPNNDRAKTMSMAKKNRLNHAFVASALRASGRANAVTMVPNSRKIAIMEKP